MYCVAAVLWTAAKFSIPRDHKLALPRRLKTLLLDMARRHASERPSAAEAIKVTAQWSGLLTFSGVRVDDSRALDAEANVNHSCLQNSSTCVGSMLRFATSCTRFRSNPALTLCNPILLPNTLPSQFPMQPPLSPAIRDNSSALRVFSQLLMTRNPDTRSRII